MIAQSRIRTQTPASSCHQGQPVHSLVPSACRRSLVEAIYNRLNLYREEDGVSVAQCELVFGPFIYFAYSDHSLKSLEHI